jgi:hypothetical protein
MTYTEIGKRLWLRPTSIFEAFKRYKNDGYRWLNRMKGNFHKAHIKRKKITGIIADYLLSQPTLK